MLLARLRGYSPICFLRHFWQQIRSKSVIYVLVNSPNVLSDKIVKPRGSPQNDYTFSRPFHEGGRWISKVNKSEIIGLRSSFTLDIHHNPKCYQKGPIEKCLKRND